jgi:hypothetical protein
MENLTINEEQQLAKATTYRRDGSMIRFEIPLTEALDATPSDIMMACGYHPGGYGSPFNITRTTDHLSFNCWATCD